jgi:hypothetical protein
MRRTSLPNGYSRVATYATPQEMHLASVYIAGYTHGRWGETVDVPYAGELLERRAWLEGYTRGQYHFINQGTP